MYKDCIAICAGRLVSFAYKLTIHKAMLDKSCCADDNKYLNNLKPTFIARAGAMTSRAIPVCPDFFYTIIFSDDQAQEF